VNRICRLLPVEISLRDFLDSPTIAGLEVIIEAAKNASITSPALMAPKADRSGSHPLSFSQQRLWFLDKFEPGNPFYNICSALFLKGSLNKEVLELSIKEIIRRHRTLRTVFTVVDGSPVQAETDSGDFELITIDLEKIAIDAREEEAKQLSIEEARRPFDLSRGPLFRAALLKLDEQEHFLLLSVHHVIFDGWSLGVFFKE